MHITIYQRGDKMLNQVTVINETRAKTYKLGLKIVLSTVTTKIQGLIKSLNHAADNHVSI